METRGRRVGTYSGGRGSFENQIGERVAFERKRRGWSKTELAKRWQKDSPAVTLLEQGKGVVARLDTLAGIAEALNAPEEGFPMSLPELLWSLFEPQDPAGLARRLRDQFDRRMQEFGEQLYGQYLAKLTSKEAVAFVYNLGLLLYHEKPETVRFVLDLVQTATVRAFGSTGVEAAMQAYE